MSIAIQETKIKEKLWIAKEKLSFSRRSQFQSDVVTAEQHAKPIAQRNMEMVELVDRRQFERAQLSILKDL